MDEAWMIRPAAIGAALAVVAGCTAVLPPALYPAQAPTAASGGVGPAGVGVSFRGEVVPILRQHCAQCHGPAGPGPFAMFDEQGGARHATIRGRMPDMLLAIRQGRMPLGRPGTVPAREVELLDRWRADGAPEN